MTFRVAKKIISSSQAFLVTERLWKSIRTWHPDTHAS